MRRRLAVVAAATTSMVVVAFLLPLALVIRSIPAERAVKTAELEAEPLAPLLGAGGDQGAAALVLERLNRATSETVTVFLPDGSQIGVPAKEDVHVVTARTGRSFIAGVRGGTEFLLPVRRPNGETAVIRIFIPKSLARRGVLRAWVALAALGFGLFLVAVMLADAIARSIVRPLADAAGVARQLEGGNLDARLTPAGPPEVAEVGRALNRLGKRIGELIDAEREAVADLSHRLRTPVTALRLESERLTDPVEAARLSVSVEILGRTVDQIIRDARRPVRVKVNEVSDLAAVVSDRVRFWGPLAEDQGRRVGLSLPATPQPVAASDDELAAAVDALLGNVFVHTPDGTPLAIGVEPARDGLARLIVSDEGPGLENPAALLRGYSGTRSTGLGLDIVARTAKTSGGQLKLSASNPGAPV